MLTTIRRPRGLRGSLLSAAVAFPLLASVSATTATDAAPPELGTGEPELAIEQASMDELRGVIDQLTIANVELTIANVELTTANDELTTANDELAADNSNLRQAVDTLAHERDRLQASLKRFDDLYGPLEADRQLLFELRKGLPETRPEAEAQLARMRSLALASDPARLGRLIDRVDAAAPAFLDWRFKEFQTTQEATEAYIGTGANAFEGSMDEFRKGVLMSVANRLDGLLTVIDRAR